MHTPTKNLIISIKPYGVMLILLTVLLSWVVTPASARLSIASSGEVVVRAVLFYSPSCGHCQKVIGEDLPPIVDMYGDQLEIILVNVTTPEGSQLFQSAAEYYIESREIRGVPTMIVGDQILIGSLEIPEKLPGIIDKGLAEGGIDWPNFPGLRDVLQPQPTLSSTSESTALPTNEVPSTNSNSPTPELTEDSLLVSEPTIESPSSESPSLSAHPIYIEKYLQDPTGNTIAVLTLLGMIISVFVVGYYFIQTPDEKSPGSIPLWLSWPVWVIPVICLAGIFIAGYMSFVELTHTEAICGPVGDCNSVQQSPYATLWGFLPVGVFGIIGYLSIGIVWLIQRFSPTKVHKLLNLVMWGMALLGTMFSIYLTFLEPFVIGATCAWCISSAILITLLLWATTGPLLQTMAAEETTSITETQSE